MTFDVPRGKSSWMLRIAVGGALAFAGYGLRAFAEGAPTMQPLFYSGTLEEHGKVVDGVRAVTLSLFDAEERGHALCAPSHTDEVPVTAGRFRVEVSSECVTALARAPDVWLALSVKDGSGVPHDIPGRVKIGAVPYALEAQHAVLSNEASHALTAGSADTAVRAERATSAELASNAEHATTADGATNAEHATAADQATSASRVEISYQVLVAGDEPGGHAEICINSGSFFSCTVAANRKCMVLGFSAGWMVGESDGTFRTIACLR